MPTPTNAQAIEADPVSRAVARSGLMCRPVPLVATAYDIRITGGLAEVVTTRTFRNEETDSIEATLTFPLPVHAVLHGLEARIGDRVVKAMAQAKTDARATYEEAIVREANMFFVSFKKAHNFWGGSPYRAVPKPVPAPFSFQGSIYRNRMPI